MMVVLALVALLVAWFAYGRPGIARWFGAFLMCG